MSRLGCLCGNGMSNSTVPSDSIAEIYSRDDFEKAMAVKMELIDLWDENQEYWYCQKCRRITVIERKTGLYVSSYSRKVLDVTIQPEVIHDWQELLFWRDKEFYDAIEENEHITVGEFLRLHPSRYLARMASDRTTVHVFTPETQEYLFSYVLDPKPDFKEDE